MAIFGKDTNGAIDLKSAGAASDGTLSIIAAGMVIVGDIRTEGVVKIEGRVEGAVRAGRQVLLGRQGEVEGDISTREAVIGGKVTGTIATAERLEIQGTATINGDIKTRSIAVIEGGKINGTVNISDVPGAALPTQEEDEELLAVAH